MLTRILFSALLAGLVAGLTVAAMQAVTTTPLIVEAERYENGGAHDHARSAAPFRGARLVLAHTGGDAAASSDAAAAWAPSDGLERTVYTSLVSVGLAFGAALVLLSAMILSRAAIPPRTGLMWGAAAFAAAGLAPALGLSPELPGAAAADLGARQAWWLATAVATGTGLWLMLRLASPLAIVAGVILIVGPHVVGAPHPHGFESAVPAELSAQFAAASLSVQAVTWALAGTLAALFFSRAPTAA